MVTLAYLVSAIAFIVGLKGLSSPRTATLGNRVAAGGMLLAVVVTLVEHDVVSWGVVASALLVGIVIGAAWARLVAMTGMPEMVAGLNGLGGLASALVVGAELAMPGATTDLRLDVRIALAAALIVGATTFSGSFVAFGKLKGSIGTVRLPARGALTGLVAAAAVALAVVATITGADLQYGIIAVIALALGLVMVLPIGGADMPVVVSLLNSLSGVAAAGTGFALDNSALIIGGALVGSAGAILTLQMCTAMNRRLSEVLFAGFAAAGPAGVEGDKSVRAATADDVAIALAYAQRVLVVPGYGLAVAQAQHALNRLVRDLEERGVGVAYGIHPVAGRMPGHMNVLLAETDVPYDQLLDLDEANEYAAIADVVLIVGANDVVNPSARDDPGSSIYGMPIIEADRAKTVVVVKRSLSPGYAGIDNPLFYDDRTMMFFDDAKAALERVAAAAELV